MSVKSTLLQELLSTSNTSSTVCRMIKILIVGGVVLVGFSPTRAAAQIFDPQSGEITVPACAQERPKESPPPAVATPAVATPAVATPAVATPVVATPVVATPVVATPTSASTSDSAVKNQGIPGVMMILEEEHQRGGPLRGGEPEEQEVHSRKNTRSSRGEEKSEDTAVGDAFLGNSTLWSILAIIGGVLLGLILNFFAVVWLIRTFGARLVPQIKVEVVNTAGGGNYPQGGIYPGFASTPWPMQSSMGMMSPAAESPRIKDPLQSEQAVLKELYQQNRELQQQLSQNEPVSEQELEQSPELEAPQDSEHPTEPEQKPETQSTLEPAQREPAPEPLSTQQNAA